MARTAARLTEGSRITDYISLGVVAKAFPRDHIEKVLISTGRTSARQRDLLKPGMLCLADRGFYSFTLWTLAQRTGADLLWRLRKDLTLPREKELPDGSFLSTFYESQTDRRRKRNGIVIRVVEYTLEGAQDAEPSYRLAATVLDPAKASAKEFAALYHERWEIETAFDELKTHLRGRQITLRSKTPDLVRQEFYGLLMAHFAIRGLIHEAALKGGVDPDRLSFMHAVRVVRRKMTRFGSLPPSGQTGVPREGTAGDAR